MLPKPLPPVEYLRSIFSVNKRNGTLIWKYREDMPEVWNIRFHGKVAGRTTNGIRNTVTINYEQFCVHRIIYKMTHNKEPPLIVDHKDRNVSNNKPINLRDADKKTNGANSKRKKRDLPRGVYWHRKNAKKPYIVWVANKYIGTFATIAEAVSARRKESKERYGEFSIE